MEGFPNDQRKDMLRQGGWNEFLSAGRLNNHKEESMKEKPSEIVEMGGDEWDH